MKSAQGPSKNSRTRGLRTGKIRTSKSSATEILRSVGVKPSEVKVATRALLIAARSSTTGKGKPRGTKGGANVKTR